MMKKGLLPIGLLAAGFVAVMMATAQDRTTTKDTAVKDSGRPGTEGGMHSYTGRIARVDADKRTIELKDVRTTGTGTGVGGTKDAATTTKDTATKDSGLRDGGTKDSGLKGGRMMTFRLGDKARITLDGKAATFSDLKADLYARVSTSARATGTVRDKDTGTTVKDSGRTGKDVGGVGRMMDAERVEVFTKDPGTGGTGRTSGTGGTTTVKDKDR